MYCYDQYDQSIVDARVVQFRDQTRRFLAGDLAEDEFRPLRLRNGLYIQRFAPMLRIAIPYGLISARQLRMLAHIARRYDKGYGHFTTRQNIQFNWPRLEEVPDILEELASVQMHAIQTSGNCIRNITSDPLSGVALDELTDPRPYCEITRQWSTDHAEFTWLPRKFKIAFSASEVDRVSIRVHDIGVQIVRNNIGQLGYRIYAGGGLGRMPMIAPLIREFLPECDLLGYLEAILRVYNQSGRRDNIHRARIKILVRELGPEIFAQKVEAEWLQSRDRAPILLPDDLKAMRSRFTAFAYESDAAADCTFQQQLLEDRAFAAWARRNLVEHRQAGYRVAMVSLKARGTAPGDLAAEHMEGLADLAERFSFGELRSTHDQNLVLADVRQQDLFALWQALTQLGLATPTIGLLTDSVACPGLDFCSLANAGTIGVAQDILERFDDLDELYDIGDVTLRISGCMNGCAHHTVGHIGILGVEKNGEEWYQITLGGSADLDACLGSRIGPAIDRAHITEAVDRIIAAYLEQRSGRHETFLDTYRRVGIQPFKDRLYESNTA